MHSLFNKIFSALSKELQKLSEEDYKNIASGKAKLEINIINKGGRKKDEPKEESDLNHILQQLNSFKSREEGAQYLDSNCKTKKELTSLAKLIDIPVQKSDKVQLLKEKIIESTIGFRIRSAAIQNLSQKNGKSNNGIVRQLENANLQVI